MTAKFVICDKNGNRIQVSSKDDLKIIEDNEERQILELKCPEPKPLQPVSMLISLDNSGSMASVDYGNVQRIEYGKQTASNLISALSHNYSEAAIQICNSKSAVINDFTQDKSALLEGITTIHAEGGTDFVEQLLNPKTGALHLAKYGKYKKVVLVFTDACYPALPKDKLEECKKICAEFDITFFAVIFSSSIMEPNGINIALDELAEFTGGATFEGVINEQIAGEIVDNLQVLINSNEACTVRWLTKECHFIRELEFVYPSLSLNSKINNLEVPQNLPGLNISDDFIVNFGAILPGYSAEKKLTLSARLADIKINSITSDLNYFKVTDYGGNTLPFTVKSGDSVTITITFTPEDSNYVLANMTIDHDGCAGKSFMLKGGFENTFPKRSILKIIQPNGGEELASNSDYPIKWKGTFFGDPVSLDYSVDSGTTWNNINKFKANGSYLYWRVPAKESKRCLMKITQTLYKFDEIQLLTFQNDAISAVEWSPDGKHIITGNYDNTIVIWDAESLKPMYTLNDSRFKSIYSISWSPDSKYFAAVGTSDYMLIGDTNGNIKLKTSGPQIAEFAVSWSPDGKYIASTGYDEALKIWSVDNGEAELIRNIDLDAEGLFLSWSPVSKDLAVATSKNARIFTFSDSSYTQNKWADRSHLVVLYSPNGRFLLFVEENGRCIMWDSVTQKKRVLNNWPGRTFSASFSSDSKLLVLAQSDYDVLLLDAESGVVLANKTAHKSTALAVSFCPGKKRFVTGSYDRTSRIWDFSDYEQSDVSDSLWSILIPKAESRDLFAGRAFINTGKDTLFDSFIINSGKINFNVDSIKIEKVKNFQIISGSGPYILKPGEKRHIEIKFLPDKEDSITSNIKIFSNHDTIIQKISGIGMIEKFAVDAKLIDFGKVLINSSKTISKSVLKNLTDKDLEVVSTELVNYGNKPYNLLNGGGSFKLTKNLKNRSVTVSFSPKKTGRISGSLIFHFKDGESAIVYLYGQGVPPCDSGGFTKTPFNDFSEFNLVGDAKPSYDFIRLTPADYGKRGAIWTKNYIEIEKGFTSNFSISISGGMNNKIKDGSVSGADGFAFVIQNYHPYALGLSGGGLGYEGIYNSFAIEFDLFCNDSTQMANYGDPNGNHLAIQTNGTHQNTAKHKDTNTLAMCSQCLPMFRSDSSIVYYVKIEYKPLNKTLAIYCDTSDLFLKPVLVLDSSNYIPFNNFSQILNLYQGSSAIVGISAATGSAYQRHDLLNWSFCNSMPSLINAVENPDIATNNEVLSVNPNPVSDDAIAHVYLEKETFVKLKIVNILGTEVLVLTKSKMSAGLHDFSFSINGLPAGTYFCILETDCAKYVREIFKIH